MARKTSPTHEEALDQPTEAPQSVPTTKKEPAPIESASTSWLPPWWPRLSGDSTRISALFGAILLFAFLSPNFLTASNLTNVIVNASVVGILAFALTLLLIARQVDLSVGSAVALSAAVFAVVARSNGIAVALVAALVASLAVAAVNIFSVVKLGVSSIIATLAGFIAYRGLAKLVLDGQTVPISDWSFLGRYRIPIFDVVEIPVAVLVLLAVFLFFRFLLKRTRFGTHMYAIGANPEAARLGGVKLEREVSRGFILSGLAVFVASLITASMVGIASPSTGQGFEFLALTAVVLGGVTLSGGRGTVIGTLIAVLILAVLDNGLVLMGIRSFWQEVARGGLLLVAVAYDQVSRRSRDSDVRMSI